MTISWTGPGATAILLVALTACGGQQKAATEPPADDDRQQITVQGVAALVEEHLGSKNVRQYGTYGQEPHSVDVMVQLRGADRRDMFVVGVSSPEGAEREFGGAGGASCEQMERRSGGRFGRVWCETLEGGGSASVQLVPYGFSDDNRNGRALMGLATEPEGRMANAMYESYTPTVTVDPQDLLELLADERLAWMTDPAVNEAGRDIPVRKLGGG